MYNSSSNIILTILFGTISSLLAIWIIQLIERVKSTPASKELQELREKPANILTRPIYTLQNFLTCYLIFFILFNILYYILPNALGPLFGNLNRTKFFHLNSIVIFLILTLLLFHKSMDSRRLTQYGITLRAISSELSQVDFECDFKKKENIQQLEKMIKKVLQSISQNCHDSQSNIYRAFARLILKLRGIGRIYSAVWIKLPDFDNQVFEIPIDPYYDPGEAIKYLDLTRKIKLSFHKEKEFEEWENKLKKLRDEERKKPKDPILMAEIFSHLANKDELTSMTGEVYSTKHFHFDSNIKWEDWSEKRYITLMGEKNWKKCKIRSAAAVPLVYNKKKLGVLMITSNIPKGVGLFDLHVLQNFSPIISQMLYLLLSNNVLGTRFAKILNMGDEIGFNIWKEIS